MSKKIIKAIVASLILIMNLTACGAVDVENKDTVTQEGNNEVISLRVMGR